MCEEERRRRLLGACKKGKRQERDEEKQEDTAESLQCLTEGGAGVLLAIQMKPALG